MIQIDVWRNQEDALLRVSITGHAQYGEYGQDIVCAAVSGISLGMVNAIEHMFSLRVYDDSDQSGRLTCTVPSSLSAEQDEKIRLLLEAMVHSLSSIAKEYPDYIEVQTEKR